jgi:hypothetical protein
MFLSVGRLGILSRVAVGLPIRPTNSIDLRYLSQRAAQTCRGHGDAVEKQEEPDKSVDREITGKLREITGEITSD